MKHNFSNYRFRASQVWAIMVDPKSKSEKISETCKQYLLECYINVTYGRVKDITNKYLIKGVISEDDSITLLSMYNKEFYKKNEQNFRNDWISGTPDIVTEDAVFDTKTSWDIWSFHKAKFSDTDKKYWWQLQSYMDLTGKDVAYLCYCLVNTPEHLIESEKRKLQWSVGMLDGDLTEEMLSQVEKACTFDDIELEDKIHIVKIERDQEAINRLHDRVMLCRQWLMDNF